MTHQIQMTHPAYRSQDGEYFSSISQSNPYQIIHASILCAQHAFLSGDPTLMESNQTYHVRFKPLVVRLGLYYRKQALLANYGRRFNVARPHDVNFESFTDESISVEYRWQSWARFEEKKRVGKLRKNDSPFIKF